MLPIDVQNSLRIPTTGISMLPNDVQHGFRKRTTPIYMLPNDVQHGFRKRTTPIYMLPMMCKSRMTVSILRQNQAFHGYSDRTRSISEEIHQTRKKGYSKLTGSGLRHIDRTLSHDGVELVTLMHYQSRLHFLEC